MRALLLVEGTGVEHSAGELAVALRPAGFELEVAPLGGGEPEAGGRTAELAGSLRELERLLEDRRPGAVLIAGDGDAALAAALVAAKLMLPYAVLGSPVGPNANLLALLAGESLPADADAIGAWLRGASDAADAQAQ